MTTRALKYGTTIIYNGFVGKIKSISNTDNVTIQLLDNTIVNANKTSVRATPHDIGELIKYKNVYYIISSIKLENGTRILYNLNYVKKNSSDPIKTIYSTDASIINVDKSSQEKTIAFLKFIDRYNSSANYLNKKKGTTSFVKLDYSAVDAYMDDLFKRCKLTMSQLNKIEHTIKKVQHNSLQIQNIYKNPFDFITQDYQLITYEKAEKICKEYSLSIDFKIKLEKWAYDLFLRNKRALYIPKWMFNSEMEKFCIQRQEMPSRFLAYINTIIIDKAIGKDKFGRDAIYKTTEYLMNYEKRATDMTIDLFYDKCYNIPTAKIEEFIAIYQEKKRIELNNPTFTLEMEQKRSVINTVQNKLSIITGPPGTGKTEILKCINFVLHALYEVKQCLDDDTTTTETGSENEFEHEFDWENDDVHEADYIDYTSDDENGLGDDEEANTFVDPKTIALIAPTGLAYVNMMRAQKAKHYNINISGTCHRILYHTISNIQKHKYLKKSNQSCGCDDDECDYDLSIKVFEADEVSMLDIFMFYDILKACKYFNSRLILLGDVEQLPSIGPGKILYQLIKSEMFTVTKLDKIKRQNAGGLVNNILKMPSEIISKNDFVDDSMVLLNIENFITNREINKEKLINLINENNFTKHNTKFITSFNKSTFTCNTKDMNNDLQNIFNPLNTDYQNDEIPSNHKYENAFTFRVNDRIIRTENDYSSSKMRANGEEAVILEFDGRKVTIQYSGVSDKPEQIGIDELYENFGLNYCVTVHKSQGSQYQNVVFLIEPNCSFIEKKAIYTAISRAKERCIVIANEADFVKSQKNLDQKVSLFMEESDTYEFSNEV